MDIVSVIKRHGKTSREVADALQTSPGYISQLGSGKTAPSIKKLDELAAAIGCHRWEFFIDEMDHEDVAQIFGLEKVERPTDPSPALPREGETRGEEPQQEQKQDLMEFLPLVGKPVEKPALTPAAAILCPHCGKAITIGVVK